MTLVVGTAGHIDHGKTSLLRALTGIDADRLPEERRRGLTIDVGYAYLDLEDGTGLDFVDVPGHDRLVGNMLVGAGEIDACLLVVAADDGPRAQTLEHLALLDALGIRRGLAAVTKVDLVDQARVASVGAQVASLLGRTGLADAPVLAVSATTGEGLDALRSALADLARRAAADAPARESRGAFLGIDRAFLVRGHGVVVTGTARGEPIGRGDRLALLPSGRSVRVREVQVHDRRVERGPAGGRVALNLSGVELEDVRRGDVLASARSDGREGAAASDRLLVALRRPAVLSGPPVEEVWPPASGIAARLHIGTDQVDVRLLRGGWDALVLPDGAAPAVLLAERPLATRHGERFILRRPRPAGLFAGGIVLDARAPRGASRRRLTGARLTDLLDAASNGEPSAVAMARLALHGLLPEGPGWPLAPDVVASLGTLAVERVAAWHGSQTALPGMPLPELRATLVSALRRRVSASRDQAAAAAEALLAELLATGRLVREEASVRLPGHASAPADVGQQEAGERLVAALDAPVPPPLAAAATAVGCAPDTVRALERAGRIVVLEPGLAWSSDAYARLRSRALEMARRAPLTPADLRDATGTNRRVVMALLEDLGRQGLLRRTPAGHLPGPRA